MRRLIVAAALAVAVSATHPAYAGQPRVTYPEYQRVQVGWYRDHVQRLFGLHGHLVVLWADETGRRHVVKTYRTDTRDTSVQITYVGPPSQHPHEGPLRVQSKALVST